MLEPLSAASLVGRVGAYRRCFAASQPGLRELLGP